MNNSLTFGKILSGISQTLKIANQVIPLYRQSKPFFNNAKKVYSLIKNNTRSISENDKVSNIKAEDNKKSITKKSNNPQFFI